MDDTRPISETEESPIDSAIPRESASSADEQTTGDDRRHILSAAALAAAVAAVGLPLIRVKPVEAVSEHCAADSYTGFDIGESPNLDCSYAGVPSDCYIVDNNGEAHWGTGPSSGGGCGSGDSGGGCGGCGGCGSCGGSGDYGY